MEPTQHGCRGHVSEERDKDRPLERDSVNDKWYARVEFAKTVCERITREFPEAKKG
jgi:hypothetical protein